MVYEAKLVCMKRTVVAVVGIYCILSCSVVSCMILDYFTNPGLPLRVDQLLEVRKQRMVLNQLCGKM